MPREDVKILMVDDQPANLLALESILDPLGFELVRASSGMEALKRLLQDEFAVILLDVFMPEMDGFETAGMVRQRDKSRHTPIIFLTAIGKSDVDVSRGYSVGAVDYLFKPLVPEILRYKVEAFVDLFLKSREVERQARQLLEMERREQNAKLAEAQRQLEAERHRNEIRIARAIQQRLFPASPPIVSGLEIWGASYPAEATGGDYFDFLPTSDGCVDMVIGDVCGHGYGPALLMATTRAYLRALALSHADVGEILQVTNRSLAPDIDDGQFVTLLLARLDPHSRRLEYSSAGHPSGYVLGRHGEVRLVLKSTAMPLGVLPDGEFPAAPAVTLEPGNLLFLHTDGLTEAIGPSGFFGIRRALDTIAANRNRPAREIVETLSDSVKRFAAGELPADDLSAIVIKVE